MARCHSRDQRKRGRPAYGPKHLARAERGTPSGCPPGCKPTAAAAGVSRQTVAVGFDELEADAAPLARARRVGGGAQAGGRGRPGLKAAAGATRVLATRTAIKLSVSRRYRDAQRISSVSRQDPNFVLGPILDPVLDRIVKVRSDAPSSSVSSPKRHRAQRQL
jgi:hypothetical protein